MTDDDYVKRAMSDPLMKACLDLLPRMGVTGIQVRWSDDEKPMIWMVVAVFAADSPLARAQGVTQETYEVGSALSPARAAYRLVEQLLDGSQCQACGRPAGITEDFDGAMPLSDAICWWRFDPELSVFRRGCSGEHDRRPCRTCGTPEAAHDGRDHDYKPDRRIR